VKNSREITVKTYKYDGALHRSWKGELVEQKDDLLVILGVFDREIRHSKLGTIHPGTISYEYYWLGRWYNIFRFLEPDGALRNYYCNVNMPPKLEGDILSYIDLDIDVFVSKEFEVGIWDTDEFAENTSLYSYPPRIVQKATETVSELRSLIERRAFPFDAGQNRER
jgi:protein associated with RNAse G/E